MSYETVERLYLLLKDKPGWLSRCMNSGLFSDDEIRKFEEIDVYQSKLNTSKVRKYPVKTHEIDGMAQSLGIDEKQSRIFYLEGSVSAKIEMIKDIGKNYEDACRSDVPYPLRKAFYDMSGIERLNKDLKRDQCELRLLKSNKAATGLITDYDIAEAKEYPIENLINVDSKGFGLCPFHEDKKPSFYTKNNYGYCFSCHESADVIKIYQRINRCDFVTAVKSLKN